MQQGHGTARMPEFLQEGEDFYHGLPSPWNVLPTPSQVSQSDYMKMMFSHTFSGRLEEYETFRALFIPIKHAVDVPIALKHYALSSSLKGTAMELVQGTLPTPEGYSLLINRLEEAYGGTFRQLDRGGQNPQAKGSQTRTIPGTRFPHPGCGCLCGITGPKIR